MQTWGSVLQQRIKTEYLWLKVSYILRRGEQKQPQQELLVTCRRQTDSDSWRKKKQPKQWCLLHVDDYTSGSSTWYTTGLIQHILIYWNPTHVNLNKEPWPRHRARTVQPVVQVRRSQEKNDSLPSYWETSAHDHSNITIICIALESMERRLSPAGKRGDTGLRGQYHV